MDPETAFRGHIVGRRSVWGEESTDFGVGLAVLDDEVAVVAMFIATPASFANRSGTPYS